jgi:hypothetical protein
MEVKCEWKIEGYHKESFHLLIERGFNTEKEARDFGHSLKRTNAIVPILFFREEPIEEVK